MTLQAMEEGPILITLPSSLSANADGSCPSELNEEECSSARQWLEHSCTMPEGKGDKDRLAAYLPLLQEAGYPSVAAPRTCYPVRRHCLFCPKHDADWPSGSMVPLAGSCILPGGSEVAVRRQRQCISH